MIRGADIVVKSLIEENAEFIFGYPGGAIMPVYDALYDYSDRIKHVLTRHEQGPSMQHRVMPESQVKLEWF